jgi:hypothetical protein
VSRNRQQTGGQKQGTCHRNYNFAGFHPKREKNVLISLAKIEAND